MATRTKNVAFLDPVWFFPATYTNFVSHIDSVQQLKNLFVAVAQCKKTKQFFVAVTHWDKQYWKNIKFLCGMWQRKWKKSQKQTSFQIWILTPLSNCFGVPYCFLFCLPNKEKSAFAETNDQHRISWTWKVIYCTNILVSNVQCLVRSVYLVKYCSKCNVWGIV